MKRTTLTLLFILATGNVAIAQNLSLFNVDASKFPTMSAQLLCFDQNGVLQSPQPTAFTISENGVLRTATAVNCSSSQQPVALSVALVIDVSSSVTKPINGYTNEMLEQQGTSALVSALDFTNSECSFTTFSNLGHLHTDFRSNKAALLTDILGLNPGGGTDYNYAFEDPTAGGLFMTSEATHKPIVIMSTDGLSENPLKSASVIAEARAQQCTIYVIALRMNCPQELKDVATQTGGMWFDQIYTTHQIEDTYLQILADAEGLQPCTLTWQSDVSCDSLPRMTSISWSADTASFLYTPPANAFALLQFNPPSLSLGNKPIGIPFTMAITAQARNSGFAISTISSSNPAFDMNPKNTAITNGSTAPFNVTFTPFDGGYTWADLSITTDHCTQHYYVSGGTQAPKMPTLKVVYPNGGEQLAVGSDAVIHWNGISPNDAVTIEYSSDNGTTWNMISGGSTGWSYPWHVPNTASNSALIRISQGLLQSDVSDEVFAIVAPQLSSRDVDLKGVNLNDYRDTLYQSFIKNPLSFSIHVDSVTISGASAPLFGIESGFAPFDVPAGGSADVEFVFKPVAIGLQIATLSIYANGLTVPVATQKIKGRGVSPVIAILDSLIDFGSVVVGTHKDSLQAITITNISNSPITITSVHKPNQQPANSGPFRFTDSTGFTLNPGDTAKLNFHYYPNEALRHAAEVLFSTDSIGQIADVQLLGIGVLAVADITPGSVSGYPGDQVNIPILLKQSSNILAAGITEFTATLSFNASLLYPIDSTPMGGITGMVRTIPLTLPATAVNGNTLTTLPFRVMLGTDTITPLKLQNISAVGGTATILSSDTTFHLLGTCPAGGLRLFDPTGQVTMARINPNPVTGTMHIDIETTERGRTTLTLANLLGATIATIVSAELEPGTHSFDVSTSTFSAGSYYLLMQTPTVRRLQRVDIEK